MYLEVSCPSRLLYSIYTGREAQYNTTNNQQPIIIYNLFIPTLLSREDKSINYRVFLAAFFFSGASIGSSEEEKCKLMASHFPYLLPRQNVNFSGGLINNGCPLELITTSCKFHNFERGAFCILCPSLIPDAIHS
jgi:hypothetical protein